MSNKSNSNKKHFILKSTITASLLLSPAAAIMQQTQIAHAAEQTKDENLSNDNKTKDLDSGKYIDTKDILKEESKKKLVPKTNESKSLVKQEAGETSSSDTYNSPMSYNNGTYEFGQGSYESGAGKALDIEEKINDDEITSKHITPTKKDNFAHITTPGETADTIGSGSGFAISKHVIVTNNHVANNRENSDGFTPYKNDEINIYPLRDGNNIPYKLKPTKVQMLKSADVTLLFVEEDLSKIMNITPLASEDEITNLKEKSDIKLTGYPVGRRHDNVVKYGETKTPYETNGKFLLNATSIHPVFYYKDYTEGGMSGSPIISNGKLIGLHAGVIDKNNGNEGDTSYGYTFTKELRKDILKAIPELGDSNTSEEPKADDPSDKDKDGGNTAKAAEEDPKDPNVTDPKDNPDKNKELDPNTNNPDGDPNKEDPAEKPDDPKSDNPDADNPSDKTDNPDSNDPDSDVKEDPSDNPDEPADKTDNPKSDNPDTEDPTDEPDSNDPDNNVKEDPSDNPDEPADKTDDPDSNNPDTEDPADEPSSNDPDNDVKEDPSDNPDEPSDKSDNPNANDPDSDNPSDNPDADDPDSDVKEDPSDNPNEPSDKSDNPDSNEPDENVDKEDPADTTDEPSDKADDPDSNGSDSDNDSDKEEPKNTTNEPTDTSDDTDKNNDGKDADTNNNKDGIDANKTADADSNKDVDGDSNGDENKDGESDSNSDDTDADKDSVDTETSLGTLDKAKEEKDLANSTSVEPGESRSADEADENNDSDKASKEDKDEENKDNNKDDKDKASENKEDNTAAANKNDDNDKNDKEVAETKEAPVDENNNGVNDAKEEAADQVQSPDELPTYDEPEAQDHQTFGPLPDTGSTAGNVAELAVITLALGGLALGAGYYLRKRNNNNA